MGFDRCFAVDVQGHSGGIALLWKNDEGVDIINSCSNFIDFECVHESLGRWRYTGYYGFPERSRRKDSWNMIRDLTAASSLPWCIIGDFNDLSNMSEKKGGQRHPRVLLDGFSEVVQDCGLLDLGYRGDKYTWERGRGTANWVQERLDRGLATQEWMEMFPDAEVQVLEVSTSDHMPLFLHLNKQVYVRKKRRFRFENMWIKENECRRIIQDCWHEGKSTDLMDKMVRCCARLEAWGGGLIKDMKMKIAQCRSEMKRLRSRRDNVGVRLYGEIRWKYMKLLERQETFWRQRAKQFWLRDGDKNTKFFHKYASARREHNKIRRLKNENGEWTEKDEEIQDLITNYFDNIFQTSGSEEELSERISFKQITEAQKQELVVPISEQEVKEAVFSMHPDKAPGIDGLNPSFFQVYWDIVGHDVYMFCNTFFTTGILSENVNKTLICLIPKVKHPKKVADLRPISLCNVLMRILSKVLANRLKPTLNALISEQQSAFIQNRLLTDNALIAYEVNHYIHRKRQGIVGIAGLKVDISKAYDRLEWGFIKNMLNKFGYPQLWIDRIMVCIKTVSYTFLRDGQVFGTVKPHRGVRQGDPFSPYIYILCAEALSGLMRQYEASGLIHGCKIAKGAPSVSHLLFADDAYFFFKASVTEAHSMRNILQKYERVSGKMVNYQKSNVIFSPNTKVDERQAVCDILEVQEVDKPGKYLGMPMVMGRSKQEVFGFLKDKVQQRINGWSTKDISKHGKLTLLSSATQMLPSFWMNLFLIPNGICEDIERKMNGFLWGRGVAGKGIRWFEWSKLCLPKGCGGLGVRDLKIFNLAMLAKQGWRLLQESNVLVSTIMKAKYYPNTTFLEAQMGANPSYVWRSLMAAMNVVKAGARRKIGNGEDTKVLNTPWLPNDENGYVTTIIPEQLKDITVSNLMTVDGTGWDMDVVRDVLNDRDAASVSRIPIPMRHQRDTWFWWLDGDGTFTVKSSYRWLQGDFDNGYNWFWRKLWALKLPGKVIYFLWRVCKGILPTVNALTVKRVIENGYCPWCRQGVETDTHVLFLCDFARSVWYSTGLHHKIQASPQETASMIFVRLFEVCTKEQCVSLAMISWSIWNRRNKWHWDKVNGSAYGVKVAAMNLLADWKDAQVSSNKKDGYGGTGDYIWQKPSEGWTKINTDAAVFGNDSIGLGCVMRNAQGAFMGARCRRMSGAWSPREAEAWALKEALLWVISRQLNHCIIETDCKALVDACNGGPGEAYFGTIIQDCIQLLKHINPVLVRFVYRSANSVAHEVAKATYSLSDEEEWFDNPPMCIQYVLDRDMF